MTNSYNEPEIFFRFNLISTIRDLLYFKVLNITLSPFVFQEGFLKIIFETLNDYVELTREYYKNNMNNPRLLKNLILYLKLSEYLKYILDQDNLEYFCFDKINEKPDKIKFDNLKQFKNLILDYKLTSRLVNLIISLDDNYNEEDFSKIYFELLKIYEAKCSICGTPIESIELKFQLLKLILKIKSLDLKYKIEVPILCCNCFNNYLEKFFSLYEIYTISQENILERNGLKFLKSIDVIIDEINHIVKIQN